MWLIARGPFCLSFAVKGKTIIIKFKFLIVIGRTDWWRSTKTLKLFWKKIMIFKIIYNSLLCHWFRFFYYIESVSLITILIFFSTWFFNCLRARGAFYCRPWNKLCRGGNCRVSFIWTTIHHPPTLMSNFLLIIASRDTTFKIFQEHTAKTKFPIYWKRKLYIITITNKTKKHPFFTVLQILCIFL